MNQFVFAKNGLIYRYWFWLWTSVYQKEPWELPDRTSLCAVCQFTLWGTLAAIFLWVLVLPVTLIGLLPLPSFLADPKSHQWDINHVGDFWQERSSRGVGLLIFAIILVVAAAIIYGGTTNFWQIGWYFLYFFGGVGFVLTFLSEGVCEYGTSLEIWSYLIAVPAGAYALWIVFIGALARAIALCTRGARWTRSKIKGSSTFTRTMQRTLDGLFGSDRIIDGREVEVLGILPTILEYIKAMKNKVCPIVQFVDLDEYVEGKTVKGTV